MDAFEPERVVLVIIITITIIIIILIIIIIIMIKKNWRAAGLELMTSAPRRTIVTDGNC